MIPDQLLKLESIIDLVKTNNNGKGDLLEDHLEAFLLDLAAMHGYYAEGFAALLSEYLHLPHSTDLQSEIIEDVKSELEYLRVKNHEMAEALKRDHVQKSAKASVFFFAVQKYLEAMSGIFQHYDGHTCDLLEFMNESGFTLKENYKDKYPSVSLNYEFRTETGKLINDDLGYKMYCVNKRVEEEWMQLGLAYGSAKNNH